jgi:hypothetical protein
MSTLRLGVVAAAALAIVTIAPPVAHAALDDTELISRSGVFGAVANGTSSGASMSADGRMVAFSTVASNLDPAAESAPIVVAPAGARGAPGARGADAPLLALLSVARQSARAGRRVAVAYVATAPADVTLTVRRGRKRVARVQGRAEVGRNVLRLPKRVKPGRYTLTLRASGAGGKVARDRGRLRLTRR